jgi:acyl carrier protein
MMEHEHEIRKFIAEKFLFGEHNKLPRDASLLEAGIVDSTGVLELISYLEEQFNIKVNDDELVPKNLDTIAGICAFLSKKIS